MSILGIDFGTCNSAAAWVRGKTRSQAVMVKSRHGADVQGLDLFPSFIFFDATGQNVRELGEKARERLGSSPHQVVWDIKSLLGRDLSEVPHDRVRYQVCEDDGRLVVQVGGTRYAPPDLAAIILQWIKDDALNRSLNPDLYGEEFTGVVVAHPAYFRDSQIRALRTAVDSVFLNMPLRLITEPEAAAQAYRLQLDPGQAKWVLAVDWGAGTLDIVLCRLAQGEDGLPRLETVTPAHGDTKLGGNDMDTALLQAVATEFGLPDLERGLASDSQPDDSTLRILGDFRHQVENLKIELSQRDTYTVDCLYGNARKRVLGARNVSCTALRPALLIEETLGLPEATDRRWTIAGYQAKSKQSRKVLERFRAHVEFALAHEGFGPQDIDAVLLTGGPVKMPAVRQVLRHIFRENGKVAAQLGELELHGFQTVDPMTAVAVGAAMFSQENAPSPPQGPPFDYGLYYKDDRGQIRGKIIISRGGGPQAGDLEDVRWLGEPGKAQTCGAYMREMTPDHPLPHHFLTTEAVFVPEYDPEVAAVAIKLSIDSSGLLALSVHDNGANDEIHLPAIATDEYVAVAEPSPPETYDDELTPERLSQLKAVFKKRETMSKLVPAAKVDRLRLLGHALLERLQPQAGVLGKQYNECRALLDALPSGQACEQKPYRRLFNSLQGLSGQAHSSGVLSRQDFDRFRAETGSIR